MITIEIPYTFDLYLFFKSLLPTSYANAMVRKHSARGEMLGSARGWKKIHIKENPPYFFSI